MRILDLEAKTGLERATIRFYEKEGLISPRRTENGYREYSETDCGQLMKIKLLRQLGLSVEKIKALQQGNEDFQAALEEQIRSAEDANRQNELFRQLIGLAEKRADFEFQDATVTVRSASNWSSSLTIDKGSNADVAVGDCVVNEEGFLVGVVTEAGLNWSTVTTLVDTSSQLGALVFRTGEITVAQGDLALMNQGFLRLSYLESESSLMNGDLIVTSGLGGYYPSGLVIGSVQEIRTDDTGLTKYAILAPQVDLDELKQVFVITDFQIVE